MSKPIIALGADHGGFPLKENLKIFLQEEGWEIKDCGTYSKDAVDYPVFAEAVARSVASGEARFGIMVDGAGIGSAMTANKIPGVRAAQCYDLSTARNAREHNNANLLTLGAGLIGPALARQIVQTFLTTECTADRHLRRAGMIDNLLPNKGTPKIMEMAPQKPETDPGLASISDEDIVRIAQRVSELVGTTSPTVPETGKGTTCSSEMVCSCGQCLEKDPDTIRQFMDSGVARIGISDTKAPSCVPEDIARCIDHTILKPDATREDIQRLCREAAEFHFAAVCISPSYVPLAARELAGSDV